MTEHEALQKARDGFLGAERNLRKAIKALGDIKDINEAEDRYEEANAAFCTAGLATSALGATQTAHGMGTKELFTHWPEEAAPEGEGGVIKSGHR